MMSRNKITYRECLQIYQVEEAFLNQLESSGLIEIVIEEDDRYIEYDYLQEIEQFVRWHYELEINMEGIEALHHMLQQMQQLQEDVEKLRGELNFYKSIF
ncbi:MAG TPA: chaperone modulator CbpM [Dysgonamonadaceae bacterium]|nr:chaperone modulator CbpM [Dysgonamonadaceae bacterium]